MKTDTAAAPGTPDAAVGQPNRRVVGLLLFVLALVVGAVALEAAARVVFDRNGMHYGIEMWKYARSLKRESANAAIGHEHIPNSRARLMGTDVSINARGLRTPEVAERPGPGVRRLLVLGDSMTFGWGVEEHETFSRVLEQKLNASGQRHEVINAGVGNYNTSQEVAWFAERGLAYAPHEVVLAFYINDAEPTPRKSEGWLASRSYMYVLLSSAWDALQRKLGYRPTLLEYYSGLYADDNPGWQASQAALDELVALCRARNIGLRVVLLPELHQVDEGYPFRFVHERVAARAARHGVPVLDLDGAFRGHDAKSLWVSPGDAHPSPLAHQIIADRLLAAMAAEQGTHADHQTALH